jgi:hypothetical protein
VNYRGLSGGLYKPLSKNDVEVIHQASLTILEKTGITYETGCNDHPHKKRFSTIFGHHFHRYIRTRKSR